MKPDVCLPPYWARKCLIWFHPEDTLEEVEGDLDELYAYWYERAGMPSHVALFTQCRIGIASFCSSSREKTSLQ